MPAVNSAWFIVLVSRGGRSARRQTCSYWAGIMHRASKLQYLCPNTILLVNIKCMVHSGMVRRGQQFCSSKQL